MEGFGEDFGAGGLRAAAGEGDTSKTRDEDDLHRGIEFGAAARQLDAIEARHDNVGEQEIEHFAFERLQGRAAFVEILHKVSGALERVDEKASQAVVILGEKNLGHDIPDFQPSAVRYDSWGFVVKQG